MARPRKHHHELPRWHRFHQGAYHYVDPKTRKWRKVADTLEGCLEHAEQLRFSGDFCKLVDAALATVKVKPKSMEQYQSSARLLKLVFGQFSMPQITAKHLRRLKRDMADRQTSFNSAMKVMKHAAAYAIEQDLIEYDPTYGVKGYPIGKRDRLVTQDEYSKVYAVAPVMLRHIMDLMYFTGQRVMDVVLIKHTDLTDKGIEFVQGKTGNKVTIAWSPELTAVVERIRAEPRHLKSTTLLHTRRGRRLTYQSVNRMWLAACARVDVPYTQLRDLRAMAGTQVKREQGKQAAQNFLGHRSERTTDTYLRDRDPIVVSGPTMRKSK